ncbi:MAG: 16S rRNA (adenine(1518)-N(6)/adenine(1519)-N(6))-dimethyltransferase RsmA [Cytophagales bacterium]|nr:16S rRNA (adenine(1518)-N(6)/adenine(1519)-N(6))-dimethyltransferase RsmA [Armatimonadota bacterium]
MDLTKPSELKRLLQAHGMTLSKRFGQNFLVERVHLERVVETARVGPDDLVLEVGPGAGTLTLELARRARRVATVELDRGLLPVLAEVLLPFSNTSVTQADALKLDLSAFVTEQFGQGTRPSQVKVVANIPYNITSPLLVQFLEVKPPFASITLMVQKEVADRLRARPGEDAYGSITVFAQFYAEVSVAGIVPRGAFFPPPKVDSAVLHLVPRAAPPVDIPSEAVFFAVSRAAFGQRRKTLWNALTNSPKLSFDRDTVANSLTAAGIDGQRRGETLSLEEIAAIARTLPFDKGESGRVE